MPNLNVFFGDYDFELVDAICRWADQNNLPPILLLAMGLQESNLNSSAHGDVSIGGSYGVYQIYVVAHGGPPEKWMGIEGTVAAMDEMKTRWQHHFSQYGSWDKWVADIIEFQRIWTPDAQGSISWSHEMAARRVGQAIVLYFVYFQHLLSQSLPHAPTSTTSNSTSPTIPSNPKLLPPRVVRESR